MTGQKFGYGRSIKYKCGNDVFAGREFGQQWIF